MHISTRCRCGHRGQRPMPTNTRFKDKDTSPGSHFMSTGLLQLLAVTFEWSTNTCGKYSRCWMLRQGWSQEQNVANHRRREHITPILHQLHGCRSESDDKLNWRLSAWYTKCCQGKYLPIWLTIFISPQKVLLAPSGPLRGESFSHTQRT